MILAYVTMPGMAADHQRWRAKAKCKDLSEEEADELFFVGRGGKTAKAKIFCSTCPVQTQCLNYAIYYNENGTWGGMSEEERRSVAPMIGILSSTVLNSYGVSTTETRDYTQWGLSETQIRHSRRKFSSAPSVSKPLQPDQQPLMLVVEL